MNKLNYKRKRLLMFIITFLVLLGAFIAPQSNSNVYADKDPAARILCRFEDGQTLANLHSTDYFHYLTRSKSAVSYNDNVKTSLLNRMLSLAGYNFAEVNQSILGRDLDSPSIEENTEFNQGPKVSAFDRFGVAGLKWSSYQGEWKYNHVEACANQGRISPTNYGSFYEGRLEPKSTHNEVSTSKDPRTIQFDRGLMSSISTTSRDIIANALFTLARFAVSMTIVFVGLSFTDITELIGLSSSGSSSTSASGIFSTIFDTIFSSFILIFILLTALYLLYIGLIKRQLRMALGTLIKTILIFIISIVIATDPSFWISVPNKVATYGQALVISSMSGIYENDADYPSLCSTEVASIGEDVNIDISDENSFKTEFEKTTQNMRSLIGCQMWEQLLFKPWVRGQFGAEYEDLYVDEVENINSDWVGNAEVPLGNEQTVENWALFHLSAQTSAHSSIGQSNFPTLVNGVNSDWWRVADAMSNYHEGEINDSIGTSGAVYENNYIGRVDSNPTEFWQSWVGNNTTERLTTSIIAIFFGIAGSIAPFIFAFSSVWFGLAITLLMITSPIFLLMGTWGGKGDKIFVGWLSALINTVIKKVGASILLIVSLALTMNIMNLAYTIGMIKSFLLMIIVTFILIKNKNKLLDMMASVDLGGVFDPRKQAGKIVDSQKRHVKNTGKLGLSTVAGMRAGIKTGQGAARGARIGAQTQLKNSLYQSQAGMHVINTLNSTLNHEATESYLCTMCYKELGKEGKEVAYTDEEGNYYCTTCAEEIGMEELTDISLGNEDVDYIPTRKTRSLKATRNRSYLSHGKTRDMMEPKVINGKFYWNDDKVKQMAKDNIVRLREDTLSFKNFNLIYDKRSRPPAPPEPLQSYIDIALLHEAWKQGSVETVERTYKEAWKMWYEENASQVQGVTQEDIDNFKNEIENYNPDIDEEKAYEIFEEVLDDVNVNERKEIEKDHYIYRDGKIVLNIYNKDSL